MTTEIRSFTGLRGIAALIVMLFHFHSHKLLAGPFQTFFEHGYLMVDVFFILSGYVMAMTYGKLFDGGFLWSNYFNFMSRRIARIYPLYALTTILAGILISLGLMVDWPGPPLSISGLINLTMMQSLVGVPSLNPPGWSISTEWMVYLIFPFLTMLCLHWSSWLAILTALIMIITLTLITLAPSLSSAPIRMGILDIWHYGTIYPVFRCVTEFTLGLLAYRMSTHKAISQILGKELAAGILIFALLILMCFKSTDIVIVLLLPPFLVSIAMRPNTVARLFGSKPLYWLGNLSFSIYMIHFLMIHFLFALAQWLNQNGMNITVATALSTLLFSYFVIVLAQLTFKFIEKPSRKHVRRLFEVFTNTPTTQQTNIR